MSKEINEVQSRSSLVIDVSKQYSSLSSCVELAKHIMDSAECEINVFDSYYQTSEVRDVDRDITPRIESICYDTIRQELYEIEDLSEHPGYKDHTCVEHEPHFRYYCGAKLTTTNGTDIGSICVLDTQPKRASNEQKKQLRQLAHLAMSIIECESENRGISTNLRALRESLHKLNHDVRTPLTGIVGVTELLVEKKENGELPDRDLKMIKESAETILDLIDEVLAGISSGSHNGERKKEEHPVDNIVDQLKRLYYPPARVKQLSLIFNNQLEDDFKVPHSFSLKLLQIVSNLVSNAVKFTPEKGMLEVTISPAPGEYDLKITVANSGSHMSANQVKAFNNGNSLERSFGTNGEQSFGVGLKYVRQMVNNAGGTISVHSEKHNGTQFTITLPKPVESTVTGGPSITEKLKNTMSNGVGNGETRQKTTDI